MRCHQMLLIPIIVAAVVIAGLPSAVQAAPGGPPAVEWLRPADPAVQSVANEIEAAFLDLPAAARRGDTVTIRVDVPRDSSCQGAVTYRGNVTQPLAALVERGGRCRWDVVVPNEARRGIADVGVTIRKGNEQKALSASFDILSGESVDVSFRELPSSARRGDSIDIRLDVPDDATCEGKITYHDGAEQALDRQTERRDQCHWELRVPEDAGRGTAEVRVAVKSDESQTTLRASFEVGRRESEADIAAAFRDLPTAVRRDDTLVVRAVVPTGATCAGTITYRGGRTQALEGRTAVGEECRWDVVVPGDARRGNADVSVQIRQGTNAATLVASVDVQSRGDDLEASFRNFPATAERGEEIDIRVDVPAEATCSGLITYHDREGQSLESQGERRERCHWTISVPNDARRGPATVRVVVTRDDDTTTIAAAFQVVDNDNDDDD